MKAAPSALTAIGGFGVAVAALSVATTASIVLLLPDPPTIRFTVAEAAAALRGQPSTLERRMAPPPEGATATLLQNALARELGRPPASVRVVWLDTVREKVATRVVVLSSPPLGTSIPGSVARLPGSAIVSARNVILRQRPSDALRLVGPTAANAVVSRLVLALPQPAFAASVRDSAGRWITVAPRRPFFSGWRIKVFAAMAVSLLMLAPLAWFFARRLTRPFRALAAAVESGGEPPRLSGPRELRDAAGAIVRMRTRLANDAEERSRMLTAVAHDLRTPLTSLKLRIEAVAEPQRARMVADTDRMSAMIHDVLVFAQVADARREALPVRASIRDALVDMPDADGRVHLRDGPDVIVRVVEQGFRRAIENLVRNALDYAGGGQIDVMQEGNTALISLADAGPGIAPEDRDRLVRPFERGDASRNRATGGTGLGLSIVQNFVDVHDGSLTLAEAPGGGTKVLMRLPMCIQQA